MPETSVKKMPLGTILKTSLDDCLSNPIQSALFCGVVYVLGVLALMTWKTMFFWGVLGIMYAAWGMFFRHYEKRKPYFEPKALFNSLIPSTKIVVLTVVLTLILAVLPFIPIFLTSSAEFSEKYLRFLQGDFEDHDMLAAIAGVVFVLISPIIAYRPFLAWISALNGRSGSLKFAWAKTKGNYIEFLVIALLTNISIKAARWLILTLGGSDYITLLVVAPVVVYFNVIAAKSYEFFFLDKK